MAPRVSSVDRLATALSALVEPARTTAKAAVHAANHLERLAVSADKAVSLARVEQVCRHGIDMVNDAREQVGLSPYPDHDDRGDPV